MYASSPIFNVSCRSQMQSIYNAFPDIVNETTCKKNNNKIEFYKIWVHTDGKDFTRHHSSL